MKTLFSLFSALVVLIATVLFASGNFVDATAAPHTVQTNPIDVKEYLTAFHHNPQRVMNTPLAQLDETGKISTNASSPFDMAHATPDQAFNVRDELRDQLCERSHKGKNCGTDDVGTRAEMDDMNQVTSFLYETNFIRTLAEMESSGLIQAQVPKAPWSDSFWPTHKGLIARRWLDASYPDSRNWIENYNYYLAVPPYMSSWNSLSPSEKYDLIVGDGSFSLTEANWKAGKTSHEATGRVPGWAGLCHGWSPASIMTATPLRSVSIQTPSGGLVTFYPSDIKALAALGWGEAPPRVNLVGTRCKFNRPKMDENGRVIDMGCFDVNPATWHVGVVNQIGVTKRSFVFDATYDLQVWNYPIYAYHYQYFNPQTLELSTTLGGAAVATSEYSIDKFKKYRSPKAKYVVGIAMDVHFAIPTSPSTKPVLKSRFESKKYVYDLELDEGGRIIGGEWYSNFHPDFLWNLPVDGRIYSDGERELNTGAYWDGYGPVPEDLRRAARISSSRRQPVGAIVDAIVRLSQTP